MNITNKHDDTPFLKATITSTKPIPDLRSLDGNSSKCLPEVNFWQSIFIVGQTEFTIDLLVFKNGWNRILAVIYDPTDLVNYLKPLGIDYADIPHIDRVGVEWDEALRLLDQARDYQNSSHYLRQLLNTLDYRQYYPVEIDHDTPPIRMSDRLLEALRTPTTEVIEIVMNDPGDQRLDEIVKDIVLRHNRYFGHGMTGHYRKVITEYSSIASLIGLFNPDFIDRLKCHLFILDLEIYPGGKFWNTFLSTQLIPYLKDVAQEGKVIILNRTSEKLPLVDLPVSVFLYNAGLA
jgi:hypothetical protein